MPSRMGKRKRTDNLRRRAEGPEYNVVTVEEAVDLLSRKCSEQTLVRLQLSASLKTVIDLIERTAAEKGLCPDHIDQLVDVIGSSKLPKNINHRLIRSLIPSSVVSAMSVVKSVSWMNTDNIAADTKALFLRWILVVFNHIDSKDILHRLYSFLFLFINYSAMRSHLCHLLYLLTRREDVKSFRIQVLLKIHKSSPQPHVLGLLSIYKLYCPHLVAISIVRSRKVFFPQLDRVWSAKVRKVIGANSAIHGFPEDLADVLPRPADFYCGPTAKRQRPDQTVVPVNQNMDNVVRVTENKKRLVPLSQIKTFDQLLQNIDKFEMPCQIGYMLINRNMQYILSSCCDRVLPLRVSYWLNHMLYEEFLNTYSSNEARQEQLLRLVVNFSEFLQEGIPVCDNFLSYYLRIWNGHVHQKLIFKLISRCRLYPFVELNEMIFEPLRQLFFCSSVYFKSQLITCFTELLQNFALFEYPRYKYTLQLQVQRELQVQHGSTSEYLPDLCSVFSQEVEEFSALGTIQDFIRFVDTICVVGLQQENSNLLLGYCVLNFFEQVAGLYNLSNVPLFHVPSAGIWYLCLFHHSAMIIARLCGLVCKYREAYAALRSCNQKLTEDEQIIKKLSLHQSIGVINTYMTDMCDMLWRNRSFDMRRKSGEAMFTKSKFTESVFCLIKPEVLSQLGDQSHLNTCFAIYKNRAFLGFSYKFLKSNPGGNSHLVSPAALKQYKEIFLDFLDQEHIHGISEFVKTCIRRNTSTSDNTKEKDSV